MIYVLLFVLTGPVSAVMLALYGIGFSVYHRLGGPAQAVWKYAYGIPFAILNFAYNLTIGTITWLEFPQELQYTTRVQRKLDEGHRLAMWQAWMLNYFDPDHVKVRSLTDC